MNRGGEPAKIALGLLKLTVPGERPLGFTVNADNGAKASGARVRSAITGAAPGSIVLAHMNHPESGTAAGVSDAITDRRAAGWEFVSLAGQIVQ